MGNLKLTPNYPTLEAVDRKIAEYQDKTRRGYLGMSSIGDSCARKLWYGFRWVSEVEFNAASLKRFADGHAGEDVQAERLRLLSFIHLDTHTKDGGQFGATDHNGHFKGHSDGFIQGIMEAPKTQHVWEHKQTAIDRLKALEKLIERDEKKALEEWHGIYYAQAVMYMFYFKMTRHYMTVASPGGRESISLRTNENKRRAESLKNRALTIITSRLPMVKVSTSPAYFECKMCDHYSLCHGDGLPQMNCRTCCHSTPELDGYAGRWTCALYQCDISEDQQRVGCPSHVVIPQLIAEHAEAIDADCDPVKWVEYKTKDGRVLRNGGDELKTVEFFGELIGAGSL